jgi:phage-related protein
MSRQIFEPTLDVRFFATSAGTEPVRDWIKSLSAKERQRIGEDLKTVQYGWPLGMPLVRKICQNVWEMRTSLQDREVRILFTVEISTMVLLHAFDKKSRKLPQADKELALTRNKQLRGNV